MTTIPPTQKLVKNYKDLEVWQKSRELVKEIYVLMRRLPKEEMYALSSQIKRAAISIPSNIAEGKNRDSLREYIYFVSVPKGSNAELEAQLILCQDLGYLSESELINAFELVERIAMMLNALSATLKRKFAEITAQNKNKQKSSGG